MKFKGVYSIEKWRGVRTWFHRKYCVFDGLGSVYFDTLSEARIYVVIKSEQLENLYNTAKTVYKQLSDYYLDKLVRFRINDSTNNVVNGWLCDCLDGFRFLSREIFPQYVISRLKYIYDLFLDISKKLKMRVLYKTIEGVRDSFYTPYPRFNSSEKEIVSQYYENINRQVRGRESSSRAGLVKLVGITKQENVCAG